jgi:septum formation protein
LEILRRAGLEDLRVIPADVDEHVRPGASPEEAVSRLAAEKARAVAAGGKAGDGDIIIAADTLVWCEGRILGKPADPAEARETLRWLSGRWHKVYTGVTVLCGGEERTDVEITRVLMRPLSEAQIDAYVRTGEPLDKAGAYGIQERGSLLAERVEGDFYNVMGLPLYRLSRMLESVGIDLLTQE